MYANKKTVNYLAISLALIGNMKLWVGFLLIFYFIGFWLLIVFRFFISYWFVFNDNLLVYFLLFFH